MKPSDNPSYEIQQDSSSASAMWVELIFGLFGMLGMGWAFSGQFLKAVVIYFGYLLLLALEMLIVGGTLGIALCLVIPINLSLIVISSLRVRDSVRRNNLSGSVTHLIFFIIGGLIITGFSTLMWISMTLGFLEMF